MSSKTYPSGTVRALLETKAVTASTRQALQERLAHPEVLKPRFFDAHDFATLRAACARLIPQPERTQPIDLAGALDTRLAENKCDGWRYDNMPPDASAHRRGLRGLDECAQSMFGAGFQELDGLSQDKILLAVQRGEASGETWLKLPATRFFEELLAELTESYYSHPLAQEEIGYVGMADATGWQQIKLNELEAREPRPLKETS